MNHDNFNGLKRIQTRIGILENALTDKLLNTVEEPSLLLKLQSIEKDKRKIELSKLISNYQEELVRNLLDVSANNIVRILILTIDYVHQNIISIGRLLNSKPSEEFENACVVTFIEEVISAYETDMLRKSVEAMRPMLFKSNDNVDIVSSSLEKKSFFGKTKKKLSDSILISQ